MSDATDVALAVNGLTCTVAGPAGPVQLVTDVSFELHRGETIGIVGESGSGKTMLVRSVMGIGPRATSVTGRVELNGTDLLSQSRQERRHRLGAEIAMIFQNPLTSLNPVVPVGRQVAEAMRVHLGVSRAESKRRSIDLLDRVGIPDPARRYRQHPHELSGGMRQRVTIAAALAGDPDVLIADEATTALDVTVQKQILVLLKEIQAERNMSVIMITHDLGVVSGRADRVLVMYAGQVVESGPTPAVFDRHSHRYTDALLRAIPGLDAPPHSQFNTIPGLPPQPTAAFVGCRFAHRCGHPLPVCTTSEPPWVIDAAQGHAHRCHHPTGAEQADAQLSQQEVVPS